MGIQGWGKVVFSPLSSKPSNAVADRKQWQFHFFGDHSLLFLPPECAGEFNTLVAISCV